MKDAHQKCEHEAKKLKVAHESVLVQQERNRSLKRHEAILLFTNGSQSSDNRDAVEYFRMMTAKSFDEERTESSTNTGTTVENHQDAERSTYATLNEDEGSTGSNGISQ